MNNGQKSGICRSCWRRPKPRRRSARARPSTRLPRPCHFMPVNLAWRDIHYTVMVEKDKKKVERKLLTGISGYAKAGQLTALMGASGAGKVPPLTHSLTHSIISR